MISGGHSELGTQLLRELLEGTKGEVTWERYELTYIMSALLSAPELEVESNEIFRSLVPETIDQDEFRRRLDEAVALLFHDAPGTKARFHHCGREFSLEELVRDLWLESGYLRWVNFYRCGPCWINVVCGGTVETFREVLHHDEGTAPFHLLLQFESLQELDCIRVTKDGTLGVVLMVHTQPDEAYEVELADDEGETRAVRPWEIRKAYFSDAADEQRARSRFH